jgi:hypothetical protein
MAEDQNLDAQTRDNCLSNEQRPQHAKKYYKNSQKQGIYRREPTKPTWRKEQRVGRAGWPRYRTIYAGKGGELPLFTNPSEIIHNQFCGV